MFSVVGGFLMMEQLFAVMLASFFVGAVIGLGKKLYRRFLLGKENETRTLIHFSFAILIGYAVVVWGCAIG